MRALLKVLGHVTEYAASLTNANGRRRCCH